MKIKKFSLNYNDEKLDKDFIFHFKHVIENAYYIYHISLILYFVLEILIIQASSNSNYNYLDNNQIIINSVALILGFALYIPKFKENFLRNFILFYYLYLVQNLVCIYIAFISKKDYNPNTDIKICLQNIILFSYPFIVGIKRFYSVLLGVIVYYMAILPSVFMNDYGFNSNTNQNSQASFIQLNLSFFYHICLFILALIGFLILSGYNEELLSKISFIKYSKKSLDLKKDQEIFNNLVPEFVQEKMKNNNRGITQTYEYEQVTILFCDISEFEKLVGTQHPKDLINLLDKIYNTFDQLCALHGVQKIETVGKTYMACGGLRECEKDLDEGIRMTHNAIRVFELSLDMIDIMQRMTLENGDIVKVKIGIHAGKVIPAVVGNHKPQFSLIGDTVNTSARMCSYSSELCVMCSETAYEPISTKYNQPSDFSFSEKFIKGKGNMKIYLHNPNKTKINTPHETKTKNLIKESQWLNKKSTIRPGATIKNNQLGFGNMHNTKMFESSIREREERKDKSKEESKKDDFKMDDLRTELKKLDTKNEENRKDEKANASISQQSVYIFENSQDMPQNNNMNSIVKSNTTNKDKEVKNRRRNSVFNVAPQIKEYNKEDENIIYNKSFFFLKFYNQNENDEENPHEKSSERDPSRLYNQYLSKQYNNSFDFFLLINILYIFVVLLGLYNYKGSYIISGDSSKIPSFLKGIIIVYLSFLLVITRRIREQEMLCKLLVASVYLFMTILLQTQMGITDPSNSDVLKIALEQQLVLLLTCLNGYSIF